MAKLSHTWAKMAAVCAVATLPMTALAQDQAAETVIATVNGEEITLGHMLAITSRLPQDYRNLPPEQIYDGVLEQMINDRILAQGVAAPDWLDKAIETYRATLLAGLRMEQIAAQEIAEDDIRATYDLQTESFQGAPEFNASHILVETEEEALELIGLLEEGADFATLAAERSTGPSGPNGGELGWFGEGRMVPAFEAAVVAMEVGDVSTPVQTQFGWHVVKLNDGRTTQPPSFDEVRDDILGQMQSDAVAAVIAGGDVSKTDGIDPAVIWSLPLE